MTKSSNVWVQTILPSGSSITQAVQALEKTSLRIVLVVDTAGALVGTVSDGDIRRALLKGMELASPVDSIVHKDALVVPPEVSREMALQLMLTNTRAKIESQWQ